MKPHFIKALIAVGCGCLLFLSCANFDIWPLAWIAWAPVIAIVLHDTTTHAWVYGFLCGLAGFAGGWYWFVGYLQRFAHLPLVAALAVFLLLIGYQAITWSLFCLLLRRLRDDGAVPVIVLAPIVFVALEAIAPSIFVPYLAVSQAWVLPVIQIAELTGPLGVSFLIILCNAMLYEAGHAVYTRARFPRRRIAAAAGILAACVGFGLVRIRQVAAARTAAPKFTVGIVQSNVGVEERRRAFDVRNQLAVHQKLSAELERRGAELIVWPESAYPYAFNRDRIRDWPAGDLRQVRRGFQRPVIFGALTVDAAARAVYNSAVLLDPGGEMRGRFDKNILILFGEYVPFFEHVQFIKRWVPEVSNLARGTDVAVFTVESSAGTVRISPMICYEDIHPSFGRRIARRSPNVLVNLTNDVWFGNSSEPWQHLALSVFRAVEMRLDLVRAVNPGVSAFVDSTGRVYANTRVVNPGDTPKPPPDTLVETVAIQPAQTLYATLGEWFGASCVAVTLVLIARRHLKRPSSAQPATGPSH